MKITFTKKHYTSFEQFFLIIWTIYSINYALFTASELRYTFSLGNISAYISYATIILLFLLMVLQQYPIKKFITYVVILIIAFLVEISVTDRSFLIYILFIMLAQDMQFDKLLRFDVKLKTVLLFIIIAFWLLGITDNYTVYSSSIGGYKQSIGFCNPNTFTCYALTILCEWVCLRYKKMRWFEWCAILIAGFFVMLIGQGRSSAYTFFLVAILFFLARIIPQIFYTRIAEVILTIITPLMCILSFALMYLYSIGNSFAIIVNEFVTNRLSSAIRVIEIYGIKLFGQDVDLISSRGARENHVSSLILDNAYAKCAVSWGVIVLILLLVLYCVLFRKLLKARRLDIVLLCLFFVLLGFGESYMLNVTYNTTLLCLIGNRALQGENAPKPLKKGATQTIVSGNLHVNERHLRIENH